MVVYHLVDVLKIGFLNVGKWVDDKTFVNARGKAVERERERTKKPV